MRLEHICCRVVDGCAEKDDAIHHQTAEDVHLCDVELTLFEDVRVEILVLYGDYVVEHHRIDAGFLRGEFTEIGIHTLRGIK